VLRTVAEFVEHGEVQAGEIIGNASLLSGAMLGLEPVDQIDDVEEAAPRSAPDERSGDRDGKVRLAGSGAADEDGIALISDKGTGGEVADQGFVDGRVGEVEVVDVLGQRQLGDGELVFDRTCLLLGDLGREQIADDPRRLVLALDGGAHDLVVGAAHPVELQCSHQVQNFGSFHQLALLRVS